MDNLKFDPHIETATFRFRGCVPTKDDLVKIENPKTYDIAIVERIPIDKEYSLHDVQYMYINSWVEVGMPNSDEDEDDLSVLDLIRFTKLMDKRCEACPKNRK